MIEPIRVLFVCLGNICRSATAEAVMLKLIEDQGLSGQIEVDSAGTSGYHAGDRADERMRKHGKGRGYQLNSISRQLRYPEDFETFDYLIAMDNANFSDMEDLDQEGRYQDKLYKMAEFSESVSFQEVPDPYYGGPEGFEHVIDILEDSCSVLLNTIVQEHHLS
ncbi:MAG: low molecular weight phosphotyrosine protein phosphatase [Deltaproteobacteria bacterium]|nr:MAG: low molecular weight phosphotyrosine protein phosphatase [Deltaproteobacteria bacterium]